MYVGGAPAGGYCASTCNRCPVGTSPAPNPAQAPAPMLAPVVAPALAPAACVDLPPNDAFTCAQLVCRTRCIQHVMHYINMGISRCRETRSSCIVLCISFLAVTAHDMQSVAPHCAQVMPAVQVAMIPGAATVQYNRGISVFCLLHS